MEDAAKTKKMRQKLELFGQGYNRHLGNIRVLSLFYTFFFLVISASRNNTLLIVKCLKIRTQFVFVLISSQLFYH